MKGIGTTPPREPATVDGSITFNDRAARAMRKAFEEEKKGGLLAESTGVKRLLFFEEGHLVGARSDLACERLGEIMVREGRITRAQLDEATGHIRSGRKLGRILVELGYLKSGEIESFVRIQIVEIASTMLLSTSERLLFAEEIPVEAATLAPISIADVFLHAAQRVTDVDLYRENVLIDDYVLGHTHDSVALSPGMKLDDDEAHVLDLIDGKNTVGEILARSPLDDDRTVRILVALHQSGVVALKEKRSAEVPPPSQTPAPAVVQVHPFERELLDVFNRMQTQNHWQVLGLTPSATYDEVDAAYRALKARFDPASYQHIRNPDFQERLSYVESRLKEAFVTLSSKTSTNAYSHLVKREGQYAEKQQSWEQISPEPTASQSWERAKNPEEAKALFQQAKRAYKERDFWRTIELCRTAVELSNDNDPDLFHLLGRALSENPRWRKDAEKNLKIAQNLKPWEPRYIVSLAKLYEKEGLQQRAQRMYEQLKVMDPTYGLEGDAD
jgi:curved DNA-binding protein CbpA